MSRFREGSIISSSTNDSTRSVAKNDAIDSGADTSTVLIGTWFSSKASLGYSVEVPGTPILPLHQITSSLVEVLKVVL